MATKLEKSVRGEKTILVRKYLKRHPDAKPNQIIAFFEAKGIEMSRSNVSYAKYVRPTLEEPPIPPTRKKKSRKQNDFNAYLGELIALQQFCKEHGGTEKVQQMFADLDAVKQQF